jgi:hypothetical protein
MKTKQLYGVLGSFILFCLLAGSCTKTSIDKDVTQNQSLFSISEAKAWLAKASNSNLTGRETDRTTIINPDWDYTVAKEDEKYQAIEIPVTFTNRFFLAASTENAVFSSKNVTKYLVLKDKKTGEVSSALMNVVGETDIKESDFHYAEVPANFSGQIFYSNAETAALINGWKYTNGKITGTITAGRQIEAAQPNCQDIEMGVYSTTCYYSSGGSQQYCDAAVLIYVYTISTCTGGTGGGGASSPSNNCAQAQADAAAFLSSGSVTSGPVSILTESNDGTDWKVTYIWEIYNATSWHLHSYEKATLRKIYYPNNYNRWEYQTFTHSSLASSGISPGGNRTFAETEAADINITPTNQSAWVTVFFSVTSTPAITPGCTIGIPPVTDILNANKAFHAP